MSEEEIIETLEDIIKNLNGDMIIVHTNYNKAKAIRGLLDLYKQEKEKNKELEKQAKERFKVTMDLISANYTHKDKIKEKIKEYEEKMNDENYLKLTDTQWIQHNYAIEPLNELLSKKGG